MPHQICLPNARYDRYVLPESVREAGLQARYCEAFSLAGEAAGKLASMNARTDALCYLLVSGLRVPVVSTMNAGELYTYFRLRTCQRAQWEIRELATEALRVLRQAHPMLFSLYGPTCFVSGHLPGGQNVLREDGRGSAKCLPESCNRNVLRCCLCSAAGRFFLGILNFSGKCRISCYTGKQTFLPRRLFAPEGNRAGRENVQTKKGEIHTISSHNLDSGMERSTHMNAKRWMALFLALTLAITMLAGCTKKTETPVADPEQGQTEQEPEQETQNQTQPVTPQQPEQEDKPQPEEPTPTSRRTSQQPVQEPELTPEQKRRRTIETRVAEATVWARDEEYNNPFTEEAVRTYLTSFLFDRWDDPADCRSAPYFEADRFPAESLSEHAG